MAEHRITVRYFASLREALGASEPVSIADGTTLGQLRDALIAWDRESGRQAAGCPCRFSNSGL
jgi:molybdopterin converting factor small subunit